MDVSRTIRRSLLARTDLGLGAALWIGFVVVATGCSHLPKIDPSGQRVFTYDTPYEQRPGPVSSHHPERTGVMVSPAKIIAPVGSEVIVQAAVCGPGGRASVARP